MESNVRKQLAKQLLSDLSSKENRKVRKQLQGARPQLLFLEDLEFINDTIRELVERKRIPGTVKTLAFTQKDLQEARTIAKRYQDSFAKRKKRIEKGAVGVENTLGGMHLKNKFPSHYKKVLDGEAFLVSSFDQLRDCKVEITTKFVHTSKENLKKILRAIDRGHGAGDGVAVSGVQSAKAFARADQAMSSEKQREEFAAEFQSFMQTAFESGEIDQTVYNDILSIQIKYEQVVRKDGDIKASYIPFIYYQDKYANRVTDKARETAAKAIIGQFFNKIGAGELASMSGSSSLNQKAASVIIGKFTSLKGAKAKIDPLIDPRKVKLKTKGSPTEKNKGTSRKGGLKMTAPKPLVPGRTSRAKQSTVSTANMLGIINAQLSNTVANNMGYPRLDNVTGTFAQSVRVTDISTTTQGFPSVGYTYSRSPYGVFETSSGSRFASAQRDPRPLIDMSIREIAAQYGLGRLYTRRM